MYYVLVYNLGRNTLPGHVFVESAPLLKKEGSINKYDWEHNKISFQLNSNDLDLLLYGMKSNKYSTIKKNNKEFSLDCNKESNIFKLKNKESGIETTIQLEQESMHGLQLLLQQAKLRIYGW